MKGLRNDSTKHLVSVIVFQKEIQSWFLYIIGYGRTEKLTE